jgi:L-2-hydroxyglutarate oxidase LhgO
MLTEIKIWILIGVAGAMATILGFTIRVVTGQVIKRLDEIVMELKQLTQATTIQGQQIQGLQEQDAMIHRRLNEHSTRIHALEIKKY